jgi:hypothetical protein
MGWDLWRVRELIWESYSAGGNMHMAPIDECKKCSPSSYGPQQTCTHLFALSLPSSSARHRFCRPPTGFIHCSQIFAPSFSKVRIVMSGNLFIAAVPPKAVTRPLTDIQSQCSTGAEVTWEPEHRLHVTIRYFGKVDKEVAVAAQLQLPTHC